MTKKVTLLLELDLCEADSGYGEIVPDIGYWQTAIEVSSKPIWPLKVIGIRVEDVV